MSIRSKEDWLIILRAQNTKNEFVLCKVILEKLPGYGFEYGYNEDDDAKDIANAFAALKEITHAND